MADHWKTLANRLGTPGIDEPEVDEIKEEKLAPEAQSSATAAPYADRESKPAMEKTPSGSASTDRPASVPQPAEPPAAPAKPAKRKSSWEALANLFNVSVERAEPEQVEPAPVEPVRVEPRPIEAAAAPEPPPRLEKRQPETRQPEARQPEARQPEARRPQPTRDVQSAATPSATNPAQPRKKLSIFDEPDLDPNAALDAMFGEAPREPLRGEGTGWGKPKRVVDDLGWDDEDERSRSAPVSRDDDRDDVSIRGAFDDSDELSDEELSDDEPSSRGLQESDEAGDDEPARRSRRRRRRGRRGRGRDEETTLKSDSDSPEPVAEDSSPEAPVSWKHDLIEVESAGPWAEPESFESDVFGADDEAPEDVIEDVLDDDDADDSGEVVRRSNRRRRRRGRGREEGPVAEGSASASTPRSGRDSGPREAGPRETTARDAGSRESGARTSGTPREPRAERSELPARREPTSRGESSARKDSGSRETAGRESGRRDGGGRDSGGRDSGGRDSGGRERDASRRDAPRGAEARSDRPRRDRGRPAENVVPRDEFEDDFVEPIDELDEVIDEGRPAATERPSGSRRRRGGRRPVDSPARSLSADGDDDLAEIIDEALEGDILDGPDDDDEGDAAVGQQHRNIPTWSDSLESIIQANTENHKRNEGRGGPRGGNRPRGRR